VKGDIPHQRFPTHVFSTPSLAGKALAGGGQGLLRYWGKGMKLAAQVLLLYLVYLAGAKVVAFLHLPIPGNVLGMLLLLGLLWTKIIPLQWVDEAAALLLKHLAFFFIPFAVGLMVWGDLFRAQGLVLLFVIVAGAIFSVACTGSLVNWLAKRREK
jgi:holin-like protein